MIPPCTQSFSPLAMTSPMMKSWTLINNAGFPDSLLRIKGSAESLIFDEFLDEIDDDKKEEEEELINNFYDIL